MNAAQSKLAIEIFSAESDTIMIVTDTRLPPKLQDWVEARKRHRLSHAHVHMARGRGIRDPACRGHRPPRPQAGRRPPAARFSGDGPPEVEIRGRLAALTETALWPSAKIVGLSMVAEDGFEPPTHGL